MASSSEQREIDSESDMSEAVKEKDAGTSQSEVSSHPELGGGEKPVEDNAPVTEMEVDADPLCTGDSPDEKQEENVTDTNNVNEANTLTLAKEASQDEGDVAPEEGKENSVETDSKFNNEIVDTDAEMLAPSENENAKVEAESENIDAEKEKALLDEEEEGGVSSDKASEVCEESMDVSQISSTSDKLQMPENFGVSDSNLDKDPSETNSRNETDNEVEMATGKHSHPIHRPEKVYNIDEETRMGLDQTPTDNSMMSASISNFLAPKKLFDLDETKDSMDSKQSANTDTEDIRLRNTLSVDYDNTKDSVASDSVSEGPTPSKRMKGYREGLGDVLLQSEYVMTAEKLFEYHWPQDGGDWHMLQEQVSEYLKVKSFKRKHPDLYRRVCDKEEKDFLREKGVVTETQSDLGLTALRSEEVYDLMMKDYNDKYQEYLAVLQERQKRVMREKHKEYGVAKLDKSKMEAYSKKAAKMAAEYNASLMREKREERQAYFDLQTYTVHHTKNRYRSLPADKTKVGTYPVALMIGQYQDNVKSYSPEELSRFPIRTTMKDPPPRVKYVLRPPPSVMKPIIDPPQVAVPPAAATELDPTLTNGDNDKQEEDKGKENVNSNNNSNGDNGVATEDAVKLEEEPDISSTVAEPDEPKESPSKKAVVKKAGKVGSKGTSSPDKAKRAAKLGDEALADPSEPIHALQKCRICKQRASKEDRMKDKLIRCALCRKVGHMSCLDLTEELVAVIREYPWQCMECKTCVQCRDPYDEDKMMFCDRCDRGYHTFCIGLDALPTGHWECRSCVDRPTDGSHDVNTTDNSHNVIKDENPDSQDGMLDSKESKSGLVILDPKPMTESDLTTDYLMRLAGRNTNWRKRVDDFKEPPATPLRTFAPTTPVVKKEKSLKRKREEATPNPTRSRPDRIQGARQSRRIKAREDEEEEKKKEQEDEEKRIKMEKKKNKKKKSHIESEKQADDTKQAEMEKVDEGDDNVDDSEEEEDDKMEGTADDTNVIESVDDSDVMFDNNEDDGKMEVDENEKEKEAVDKKEKDNEEKEKEPKKSKDVERENMETEKKKENEADKDNEDQLKEDSKEVIDTKRDDKRNEEKDGDGKEKEGEEKEETVVNKDGENENINVKETVVTEISEGVGKETVVMTEAQNENKEIPIQDERVSLGGSEELIGNTGTDSVTEAQNALSENTDEKMETAMKDEQTKTDSKVNITSTHLESEALSLEVSVSGQNTENVTTSSSLSTSSILSSAMETTPSSSKSISPLETLTETKIAESSSLPKEQSSTQTSSLSTEPPSSTTASLPQSEDAHSVSKPSTELPVSSSTPIIAESQATSSSSLPVCSTHSSNPSQTKTVTDSSSSSEPPAPSTATASSSSFESTASEKEATIQESSTVTLHKEVD